MTMDVFLLVGYIGAILYAVTAIWHGIKFYLGKDLFKNRIDLYLNYSGLGLLVIAAIGLRNIILIIFFTGSAIALIIGAMKPRKKK